MASRVTNCARCGETHDAIEWHEFQCPCMGRTHWSACPTTGEPILMMIVRVDAVDAPSPEEAT
jgi:hypothetical protein